MTERVGGYLVGSAAMMSIALADRLGILVHLAEQAAPLTSDDVASALKLSERFVRELLFSLVRLAAKHAPLCARDMCGAPSPSPILPLSVPLLKAQA